MGSGQSVLRHSPLACIKRNLKPLLLTDLKVHKLESLCTQIWPQYKLGNQNHWPEFRTSDFNILSDLTNFLKWNGKWSEVPYIQAFWNLRSRPSLCKDCSVQFSRSVVSDSLLPHELQHTRPPCPSSYPGVHSDSRPSSQ